MLTTSGSRAAPTTARTTPVAAHLATQGAVGRGAGRRELSSQVDRSSRRGPVCRAAIRTSSTTMTMAKSTRSTWVVLVRFHTRISWITPTPMAATKAAVRLTMAPTMAAVRASRSSSGLSTWVSDEVWPGAARMAVKADSTPATVQAMVEVRRTQTPDSRAESAFSAMARMARPHGDHLTNAARPMATTGAATRVMTWPGGEEVGADVEGDAERDREGLEQVLRADEGQCGEDEQDLAQPDGGHHHQHPGPVEQPPEQQLAQGPDRGGQAQGQNQGEPVVEPEVVEALDHEDGRHHPELALGEVEHPVGLVDEHEAHGQQAVAEAGDDSRGPGRSWGPTRSAP